MRSGAIETALHEWTAVFHFPQQLMTVDLAGVLVYVKPLPET